MSPSTEVYAVPRGLVALCVAAMLAGCAGQAPLRQDGPVHLAPGQGLAALVVDTLDPLTDVEVEARSGGPKLRVASVPVGRDVYLFVVPAGTYCMTRFKYANMRLAGSNGMLGCFVVREGQLSYSGTLAPRVEDGRPVTHQVQDPPGFRILLQQQYPRVAKQFPTPSAG